MNLTTVNAAGRPHIGHHSKKRSILEQTERIHAGFATHHRIPAALEGGLHIRHDRWLIFDEQHGQGLRLQGWQAHGCFTPAATPKEAVWEMAGSRTMKVAPWPPI